MKIDPHKTRSIKTLDYILDKVYQGSTLLILSYLHFSTDFTIYKP